MLIDGKAIAEQIYTNLRPRVAKLPQVPVIWDVLVGQDLVQEKFVSVKKRRAEELGFRFECASFPLDVATEEIVSAVVQHAQEPGVCGLIVQLPLPSHIDTQAVVEAVPPSKDIDCLSSLGTQFTPPTAGAVMYILDSLDLDLSAKCIVVVGQGRLVGKPTTLLLQKRGFLVNVVDVSTVDQVAVIASADVLITGVGKPGFITPELVRPGVVVVDAGTSESGGTVKGDVLAEVSEKASFFTPVPGGVGPVTVALLLQNAVLSAEKLMGVN